MSLFDDNAKLTHYFSNKLAIIISICDSIKRSKIYDEEKFADNISKIKYYANDLAELIHKLDNNLNNTKKLRLCIKQLTSKANIAGIKAKFKISKSFDADNVDIDLVTHILARIWSIILENALIDSVIIVNITNNVVSIESNNIIFQDSIEFHHIKLYAEENKVKVEIFANNIVLSS